MSNETTAGKLGQKLKWTEKDKTKIDNIFLTETLKKALYEQPVFKDMTGPEKAAFSKFIRTFIDGMVNIPFTTVEYNPNSKGDQAYSKALNEMLGNLRNAGNNLPMLTKLADTTPKKKEFAKQKNHYKKTVDGVKKKLRGLTAKANKAGADPIKIYSELVGIRTKFEKDMSGKLPQLRSVKTWGNKTNISTTEKMRTGKMQIINSLKVRKGASLKEIKMAISTALRKLYIPANTVKASSTSSSSMEVSLYKVVL